MTDTDTLSSAVEDGTTALAPPDWSMVPFDVGCARCGHDLRGQSEPKCPACRFEFEWAERVPIAKLACPNCRYRLYGLTEPRCPECGTQFDWQHLVERCRAREKVLFEYHWRDGILTATLRLWRRLLRPGTFWRSVDLVDPPGMKTLLAFTLVNLIALGFLMGPMIRGCITLAMFRYDIDYAGSISPGRLLGMLGAQFIHPAWELWLPVVLWCVFTLAALLAVHRSADVKGTDQGHVLRLWAYSTTGLLLPTFVGVGVVITGLTMVYPPFFFAWHATAVAYVVHVTWSLRQGMWHYLKYENGLPNAIVVQIFAILGMTAVMVLGFDF